MDVGELSGVPGWFREQLRERGIESLYPPQAAAVEAGVTDGESVVAAVPTASGKTLVAELAMLSAVAGPDHAPGSGPAGDGAGADGAPPDDGAAAAAASTGGTALYIVPLRALASEKHDEFAEYEAHGLDVAVSTGNYESDGGWLADKDVVVATSEKVDSLVRNGAGWVEDLDCVVADEVHLVDDGERGPTLEVTLAKLRRLADPQVVALSATVGNAAEVADWLDAELVDSEWRPIDLRKGVHYGQALHLDDGSQREVPVRRGQNQTAGVVVDTVEEGGSSLVFVNSRRNAEAAASRLGDAVADHLTDDERADLRELAEEVRGVSDTETSDDLADAVLDGAAFHHAGCAREHRALVEAAFRDRLVKVIAATPTLAAGVNTPSRRVVVRDWQRYDGSVGGMQPLDVLEVHQMMGRAGRPGLDPYGEAVLVASSHEEMEELFERYVWADPEPVRSKLAAEPALRTHILATVASGFANTRGGLLEFLEGTLYATQSPEEGRLESVTDRVLGYLERNEFLEREGDTLTATPLGHSVSRLYLDPMSAAEIVDGLRDAAAAEPDDADEPEAGFRPASEMVDGGPGSSAAGGSAGDRSAEDVDVSALGLYHLVARTPDMYELYLRSGDRERFTETAYEREEELLGRPPREAEEGRWEDWLAALKTARLLEDWADEVEEDVVTERYGVGPGDVSGKTDTAEWLLGAAETLATELDLPDGVRRSVARARMRVEHGVREELLDLASVRNVGRVRARRLFDAGIEDREALREAEKAVVLGALQGRERTAETVLENAGHRDPDMDGVVADDDAQVAAADGGAGAAGGPSAGGDEAGDDEDQANLGDF